MSSKSKRIQQQAALYWSRRLGELVIESAEMVARNCSRPQVRELCQSIQLTGDALIDAIEHGRTISIVVMSQNPLPGFEESDDVYADE